MNGCGEKIMKIGHLQHGMMVHQFVAFLKSQLIYSCGVSSYVLEARHYNHSLEQNTSSNQIKSQYAVNQSVFICKYALDDQYLIETCHDFKK
jgi:hypothetical protein